MTGALSLWQLLFELGGIPLLIALLPLYLMALTKGDSTDRACAHVLAFGVLLFVLLSLDQRNTPPRWPYSVGQLLGDLLLLTVLMATAVNSVRRYPVIMAAAQLLIVLAGSLAVAGLIAQEKALAAMIGAAAIIQLGAFVIGLIHPSAGRPGGSTAAAFAD